MKRLTTAVQVVDHLGGLDRVCEITVSNRKQAQNWPTRFGKFPAATHAAMTRALARRKATAPARLWNQRGV